MDSIRPSEARHAYSAMLLMPGYNTLRFHTLLTACRKRWNKHNVRYPYFWDPTKKVQTLLQAPLDWGNMKRIRARLIMSLRLFHLFRSIDIARTFRSLSSQDSRFYIVVQLKVAPQPTWEQVIELNDATSELRSICPLTLLLHYVRMTAHIPPGSKLIRSLNPPFTLCLLQLSGPLQKVKCKNWVFQHPFLDRILPGGLA